MTALQLLSQLRQKGARLWNERGKLRLQAPPGTLTEDLRRALAQHKQEILALLTAANAGSLGDAAPPLKPVPRSGGLPLSFAQQRLWFLQQLTPDNTAYHMRLHYRLTGLLNPWALGRSLNEIIRRHESMRTTFSTIEGKSVQVIATPHETRQPLVDLSDLARVVRESETQRLARLGENRPFDLSEGPLFRSILVKSGTEEHVWLLEMHHIISDGWSMGIFAREFMTLYQSFSTGRPSPLPELPVQYADFAQWQRRWLQGALLERQSSYWKNQLEGAPSLLELPTDRPRQAVPRYEGRTEQINLPQALADGLRNLSHNTGATLFMTLMAAFKILLWRYTAQPEIVVGSPIAGRTRPEIEELIGFFVNTLVLRSDLSGNPTFREFLAQVRLTALDAYAHQDVPFEYLVEQLRPERNLGHSPIFQVMFVLQNAPREAMRLPGITIESVPISHDSAKFDLTLALSEAPSGIQGALNYNTDLFDTSTIQRMIGHFKVLLEGIVADPGRRVSTLPLLTEVEKQQLLVEWNDTSTEFPSEACIQVLFEEQVERTPEAVAVVFEEEQVTYRELNQRANQLAHYLRTLGVGPDVLVGLCLERSVEMVMGLLGILKAGGAHVPLDPTYPQERLAFMMHDAHLAVLVTHSSLEEAFSDRHSAFSNEQSGADGRPSAGGGPPSAVMNESQPSPLTSQQSAQTSNSEGRAPRVVCLDQDSATIALQCPDNPANITDPQNTVYVIYTSGSTGLPKGVCVAHGALAKYCQTIQQHYELTPGDRMFQFASLNFDQSLNQIFTPLITGATVVLRTADIPTAIDFYQRISRFELTVVNLPPAYWKQLVQNWTKLPGSLDPLRLCIVGGDVMPADALSLWYRSPGRSTPLMNGYGPTEAVITATTHTLVGEMVWARIPIGRPLAGRHLYVCDRGPDVVPVGVRGELHIGGPTLARGYLGHPDLTAEKFIPDSFNPTGSSRLYRTGDLVRYLRDGNIEFLGRIDHQVKIRGFRIELGEIEIVLMQCPQVREAVVVVQEERKAQSAKRRGQLGTGDRRPETDTKQLVAYVVAGEELVASTSELRAFLAKKLPDYMVPQFFVVVHELPLTPNGKLDRKALPKPEGIRPDVAQAYVEPRTETEELLAGIWSDVLRLERVGIHDNFFELGGHSLLATQVVSRVREAFAVEIPLRALFEAPTIEGLAERVDNALCNEISLRTQPIVPVTRDQDLPPSFEQQRLWFLDQLEPGNPAYNVPGAIQIRGTLDTRAFEASLGVVLMRHETLRTTFRAKEGTLCQVVNPGTRFALPRVDLRDLPDAQRGSEAQRLVHAEALHRFDLAAGPLFRPALLTLAETEHVFIRTVHHIIWDGWSSNIFYGELWPLYTACVSGQPHTLSQPPIQYGDFATWQRARLQGQLMDEQLAYWARQLADVPATLDLPADRPHLATRSFRGGTLSFRIANDVALEFRSISRRAGVTPFMAFLAAFQTLLARYTSQDDIPIGTPISLRDRVDLEPLIGFFVNTVVLRSDLSRNPTFRELLYRVRKTCLEAFANSDLPFEKVVEELHPERRAAQTPLFQILFSFQRSGTYQPEPAELHVLPMTIHRETATFDLALSVADLNETVALNLEYSSDLFDRTRIEGMLRHFDTLLRGITENPDQRIQDLPLLTDAEREQLLVARDHAGVKYTQDTCLHSRFEAQVELYPEAIAAGFPSESGEGNQITYGELNSRANQVAGYLRKTGVGPEVRVGICLERSLELVVAILGILKAGGTYVPLDPSYPTERLAFMIEDSGIAVLITDETQRRQTLGLGPTPPVVCLDAHWSSIRKQSTMNPISDVSSNNTAYVIYTSGSTGAPKGVLVGHRHVGRLFDATETWLKANTDDVWLLFHSYTFDVSVWELWGALLYGGRLVVVPFHTSRSPHDVHALLDREGVTVLNQTPSAFYPLIRSDEETGRKLLSLRLIIFAGEALNVHALQPWFDRYGDNRPRLVNMYGITETTVHVTECPLTAANIASAPGSPIGHSLPDLELHLLDAHQHLVPVGLKGEIYVGGAGVAVGYLKRPELTGERFVPNALGCEPGARLYKSGDLARYRSGKKLEFIGRVDNQVKIRGFRVELGEIEAVLTRHPGVGEAVVMAEATRLIAYVVSTGEASVTMSELRQFLKGQLPDHMIPAVFVNLDSLPLTSNGKVDKKALPEPDTDRPQLGIPFAPPRTPVEEQLAHIWCGLLQIDQVGVYDNFFELGGHSLLLTQLASRIADTFNVRVPLRILFDLSTIDEMTQAILQERAKTMDKTRLDQMLDEVTRLTPAELTALLRKKSG